MIIHFILKSRKWEEHAVRGMSLRFEDTEDIIREVREVLTARKKYEQTHDYQPRQRRPHVKPD